MDFRRALADKKHDMKSLQAIWDSEKREGIEKLIKDLESIKEEDREEVISILEHHFDEEKKPLKPVVRRDNNNGQGRSGSNIRRNHPQRMNNKDNRGSRPDSRRRRNSRNDSKRRGQNGNPKTGNVQKDQQIMNNNGEEYENTN